MNVLDLLPEETLRIIKMLVDPRTGLLTISEPYVREDLPTGWLGWTTSVADTRLFGDEPRCGWRADPVSFGASVTSLAAAAGASIGEAVERYCGNRVPTNLVNASWNSLTRQGLLAVEPEAYALYAESQYRARGFPFVRFTREHVTSWVEGKYIDTGEPVYVPAPLVYLDYYRGDRRRERPIAALQYAGIAAGRSLEEATVSGLLELVERDASALWWFRRGKILRLSDWETSSSVSARLWDRESDRHIHVFSIPNAHQVPVAVALVEDRKRQLLTFGSAARNSLAKAIEKAVVEAYAVSAISIDLSAENGPTRRAVAAGVLPEHLYVPHREDRGYGEDYPKPFLNMLDLPSVGQYYLDPDAQRRLLKRFSDCAVPGSVKDVTDVSGGLRGILESVSPARPIFVNLTTCDVEMAGLFVVRVIVPGWYNNSPPAYPLLGGERMMSDIYELPDFDLPLPLA